MKQKTPVNSQRKALGTLLPVEQHPPVNGVNRPPVPLFIAVPDHLQGVEVSRRDFITGDLPAPPSVSGGDGQV